MYSNGDDLPQHVVIFLRVAHPSLRPLLVSLRPLEQLLQFRFIVPIDFLSPQHRSGFEDVFWFYSHTLILEAWQSSTPNPLQRGRLRLVPELRFSDFLRETTSRRDVLRWTIKERKICIALTSMDLARETCSRNNIKRVRKVTLLVHWSFSIRWLP